jgi:hypothetical protein
LAAVKKNDYWGYIDTTGKLVIKCKYVDAGSFSEVMAWVSDGTINDDWECELYGYINTSGKLVIKYQYGWVYSFYNGVAIVGGDPGCEEAFIIDKKGNEPAERFGYTFGTGFYDNALLVNDGPHSYLMKVQK